MKAWNIWSAERASRPVQVVMASSSTLWAVLVLKALTKEGNLDGGHVHGCTGSSETIHKAIQQTGICKASPKHHGFLRSEICIRHEGYDEWGALGKCFDLTQDDVRSISSGKERSREDSEVHLRHVKLFVSGCIQFVQRQRPHRNSGGSKDSRKPSSHDGKEDSSHGNDGGQGVSLVDQES